MTATARRAHDLLRRRPNLAGALIIAAIVLVFLSPGLMPGKTLSSSDSRWFETPWLNSKPAELTMPSNPELGDSTEHLQLFLRGTAEQFPDMPLWNPSIVAGRPYLANLQAGVFSPYSVLAYVLPFWTALSWIAVLKLWLAGFGTFLLGRALGMRFGGALMAAVVFALSLKTVTWVIYPNLGIWALIPWLLVAVDRLVKRPDLLSGACVAALVGIQFLVGHPETSFHALLAAAAFGVLRAWRGPGSGTWRGLLRPAWVFGAAVLGGVLLAAVTLVPFGELLWLSADVRDRAGDSVDVHLPFEDAIGIFMPDYWGRPTQTITRAILLERAMYVGALPLMLVAAALILGRTRERVAVALFGGFWLAVVLGVPPFVQVVTRLPVFNAGHNTRLIILPILCAALLAGWGLDDVASRVRERRLSWRVIAVSAALVATPIIIFALGGRGAPGDLTRAIRLAFLFQDPHGNFDMDGVQGVLRLAALMSWLTLAGASLLLLVLRLRGRLRPTPFVVLAVLLVCVDLFRIGMGYNPAIDRDYADQPATGAIRYLQSRRPARFVSTEDVPQNVIAMRFGLEEAKGYDLPIIRRYDRFWRREVVGDRKTVAAGLLSIPLRFEEPTPRSLRALRLLGVENILRGRVVFIGPGRLLPLDPLDTPGLTEVYGGADARVYRVKGALPRAFVVGAQRTVDGEDAALDAISAPGFDARTVAVTEKRLAGLPQAGGGERRGGAARITSYEPERVVVRARSRGPGLLVLGDNHFPGWKAEVDGRPADIEHVDYLFRGVRVGPGTHTVEFRYEPLSWTIGWIVSVISLVGLGAAIVVGRRRRRRQSAAPAHSLAVLG